MPLIGGRILQDDMTILRKYKTLLASKWKNII